MYTHVSLFAGLGGFIIAGNRHGFNTVHANEIEQACRFVLQHNFPGTVVSTKDVRDLEPARYAELSSDVDVMSAGFPCQPFSVAGENLGFDDERGKLFYEIPRICVKMERFPKVLILENVPHLKIFDNGSRLRIVLNELRRIGYWVSEANTAILDAYDYGDTPQRRERLYIVAVHSSYFKKNKFRFPEPRVVSHKTIWNYIDRTKKAQDKLYLEPDNKYARMIDRSSKESGTNRLFQIRRTEVRACPENICPTLTANMGGGGHNVPFLVDDWGIRRLSVEEVAILQCINPEEFLFPPAMVDSAKLMMLGNAICVDVVAAIFKSVRNLLDEVQKDDYEQAQVAIS